ncbi:hypothetical protein DSM104443_01681 [Usitatibacter rugosus]|uniref:DnaJ-like protein n=1 Tax=Usitatibacter rugosus TaxID=2732067 RepID=A0A6M4GYL6_9PROT|nr:hypothetical protein [Usitatibacter rugosus]QJR10617.1 hypothetical protein DSM104443_01681 [Usitatibacter rugosus]
MQDYYQVLGVSEQATPAVIQIAFEGKLKALHQCPMNETERMAEDRLLRQAFVTLTHPARKTWYDMQLERDRAALTAMPPRWRAVAIVAMVTVGFTSFAWHAVDRSQERDRRYAEALRVEAEQAKVRAEAAVQLAQLAEAKEAREAEYALRREREMRYWIERDRNYSNAQSRYNEVASRNEWYSQRHYVLTEARTERYIEDRRQRSELINRYAAQAEVNRQVQWMENREAEEAYIRSDKHYRAQQEAAQIKAREAAELRRTNGLR